MHEYCTMLCLSKDNVGFKVLWIYVCLKDVKVLLFMNSVLLIGT